MDYALEPLFVYLKAPVRSIQSVKNLFSWRGIVLMRLSNSIARCARAFRDWDDLTPERSRAVERPKVAGRFKVTCLVDTSNEVSWDRQSFCPTT